MPLSDFIEDLAFSKPRRFAIGWLSVPWPFPLAYGLHSSSAMVFGRPVYGAKAGAILRACYRAFRAASDAKYWLYYRLHPAHRYHMIDTKLGYGYHERDDQLLYGAMACLIGYVEDCERSGCHDPGDEARAILKWWREKRPADQAQHAKWMHELYSGGKNEMKFVETENPKLTEIVFDPMSDDDEAKRKAMWALDEQIHKDEQDHLHRLIEIRPSMWT